MMKSIFLSGIFLMVNILAFTQIVNQNEPVKTEAKEKKIKNDSSDWSSDSLTDKSEFYLTGAFIHSFREFEDQSVFQSLGDRNNEAPINTYGLGFGTFIKLSNHFDLELGVSYVLQGEKYSFSDSLSDSTFNYTNKYRHFGLPLRLKYTIGESKLKGFVFGGIIPSSILSIKYSSDYVNKSGSAIDNGSQSITNNLKAFNVAASAGFGLLYKKNDFGYMIMPEFRYNLINSYEGFPVKHNLWSWGINAGLLMNF